MLSGLTKYTPRHKKEVLINNFGGVCWTKFETISSKIQMIKNTNADEARRNYLSGGKDSPCLG